LIDSADRLHIWQKDSEYHIEHIPFNQLPRERTGEYVNKEIERMLSYRIAV